jgi:hypothetical protein
MDAATIYVVVQLANGEVKPAEAFPLGDTVRCQEMLHTPPLSITEYYRRIGAKSVKFYCAPTPNGMATAR